MAEVTPEVDSIKTMLQALSPEEKDEFLQELYIAVTGTLKSEDSESAEQIRQILLSWEYTAIVKSNGEFVEQLDRDGQEVKADDSPGTDWRELLKGGEKMDASKTNYLKEAGIQEINPKHTYFKMFGSTPMFYSEEYLNNSTIEELKAADQKNADYFSSQQK